MTIKVDKQNKVTIVSINRPDRKNAVNRSTAEALAKVFKQFDEDSDSDVAILTGIGGVFCSGADLKAFSENEGGNRVELGGDGPMGPTRLMLSKPVIAAVEGFAVAGGLELSLWCDLRVAAEDAVFGVYCRRWGVPLVDGGTIRLPRMIGLSHAMDLILTGRGVSGEEAKAMGLINRLCLPGKALEVAMLLAQDLLKYPQLCMRNDRMSALEQWNMSLPDALLNETKLGMKVIESGESKEGAEKFSSGKGRHGSFQDI